MQLVLLIGIPASGKSTFYVREFVDTHVRINLDMLKTRHRERLLLNACLEAKQPVVVDNTNVTAESRATYIKAGRAAGFEVVGYYFRSVIAESLERNARRDRQVPERGVVGMASRLEQPGLGEGFDVLHYVRTAGDAFLVSPWEPGT